MKTLLHLFISIITTAILFTSCNTSQKLVNQGKYDQAINRAVKKLKRNKSKDKEIVALQRAYVKSNLRDNDRIGFLRQEGNPENWDDIFNIYSQMNVRQNKVKPLLPLVYKSTGKNAEFEIVNYNDEIINAKQKAAEYFYTKGKALLETKNKYDARKAYDEFYKVKCFYENFKDIDDQIKIAQAIGTSYVLFKMENKTGTPLPPGFEEDLIKISMSELNKNWLVYETTKIDSRQYDYTILVHMKHIDVSPESVKEYQYEESKTVPDGFQYVLDKNGNVMKDSLGNDIKVEKFKEIKCKVIEVHQFKKAIVGGSLDFIDNKTNQLIKTNPIAAENFFEFRSATAIGDLNALKPETKAKLGLRPVPFPPSFDMILKAGQTLKSMVKDIIWNNAHVLN